MDFQLPYIISVYNEQLEELCHVDIFVPSLPKEYFIPFSMEVVHLG
jgi:hypothetical protein